MGIPPAKVSKNVTCEEEMFPKSQTPQMCRFFFFFLHREVTYHGQFWFITENKKQMGFGSILPPF